MRSQPRGGAHSAVEQRAALFVIATGRLVFLAGATRAYDVRLGAIGSAGRNEDSVKILGFWHFFVSRNPRNLRPESSSLVSTSLTRSGDDEDSEDSGIISLFFCWNLRNLESSHKTQLQNVCALHWRLGDIHRTKQKELLAFSPRRGSTASAPRFRHHRHPEKKGFLLNHGHRPDIRVRGTKCRALRPSRLLRAAATSMAVIESTARSTADSSSRGNH